MRLSRTLIGLSALFFAGTAASQSFLQEPATPKCCDWRIPERLPERMRLVFAGDLMQHLPQVNAARRHGAFDYSSVFAALRPRFDSADLVVVNLETTLTRSGHYSGYPCFRSPAALADAMQQAGIDVAVLANNHCCDGGVGGLKATAEELDRCGILHTGAFADSAAYQSRNPLFITRNHISLALLNYTYGTNGLPTPKGTIVNRIDTIRMVSDLKKAHAGGVDAVVVCIHWGIEYQRAENREQRMLAGFLARHGVDLIIGSHPHVVQPWKTEPDRIVVYSLGNFVSNQRQPYTDGGILAQIDATKHPDGKMSYQLEVIPVWVSLPGYQILPPEVADTLHLPASYQTFRREIDRLSKAVL